MKKIINTIIIISFFVVSSVNTVYAHILKTDGTIGAVLHMSPDDDPVAGETTALIFEIKDTSAKFDPNMCMCTVQIIKDNDVIKEESIFTNSTSSEQSVDVIFPARGIYQIRLKGESHTNSFNSFQLQYDVRVEKVTTKEAKVTGGDKSSRLNSVFPVLIIPLAVVGILGVFSLLKKRDTNNK